MKRYFSLEKITPDLFENPVVTLGVFDGLHVGHRAVITALTNWAKDVHGDSVVITFDRHPQVLLSDSPPPSLTSLEFKLRTFEKWGVDAAVILPFDRYMAALPADGFAQTIIGRHVGAEAVLLGFDTRYGARGEGDFNHLVLMAEIIGFKARRLDAVTLDGERVSSTLVRKSVSSGDMERASRLLGRHFCIEGNVVSGFGRGRTLGFPTANLDLLHDVKPPAGVYGGRALVDYSEENAFDALISIGRHPTFGSPLDQDLVEVLLLDFNGDLADKVLCTEIHFRMRDQEAFENKDELKARIAADVEEFKARKA